MIQTYFFLFIDSLRASLVFPIKSELTLPAMLIFEAYDKYLIFAVALIASIVGLIINWQIGKFLFGVIKKLSAFDDNQSDLPKLENFWNKYLIWLMPVIVFFSAIGPVFCLFCGFFRVRFWYLLPLILCGRLIYYLTF